MHLRWNDKHFMEVWNIIDTLCNNFGNRTVHILLTTICINFGHIFTALCIFWHISYKPQRLHRHNIFYFSFLVLKYLTAALFNWQHDNTLNINKYMQYMYVQLFCCVTLTCLILKCMWFDLNNKKQKVEIMSVQNSKCRYFKQFILDEVQCVLLG